jgi:preprotein translocase subunit SecG
MTIETFILGLVTLVFVVVIVVMMTTKRTVSGGRGTGSKADMRPAKGRGAAQRN